MPKARLLWLVSRNNLGKEFHSLGPSTENARRPHEFRRRRWRLCAISETGTQSSQSYRYFFPTSSPVLTYIRYLLVA